MIKPLSKKTEAQSESNYTKDESAERLKGMVRSGWNPFPMKPGVYGKVSEDRVRLYRVNPFVRNSFIPIFIGAFRYSEGKVVLVGTYSTHVFVRIFMGAWFTLVIMGMVFTSLHIFQELTSKGTKIFDLQPMLLISYGLFVFGVLVIKVGKWFSRNDISYISKVIRRALRDES